jgi:hypothetical protein
VSAFPGRRRPRIAVAIAGVVAWSWLAAAPVDVVRDCGATASPAISGIKGLGAACPQLEEALQALGLEPMLYDGWREGLNRDALRDLTNLAEGYAGLKPRVSPDIAALPGILKTLAHEQTPLPKSWWDAFRAWFKIWLSHHPDALTWLDRWLDRIGQSTTLFNIISYSMVALVLLAAAAVILNELKASGAVRRRRDRGSGTRKLDHAAISSGTEGLEPIALAGRLTELLRILVSRLVQTRRLKADRSLTHRELVVRSTFEDESQRAVFAAVAGAAESILYGRNGAAPDQLNGVLHEGQALLAQLSDPPSAR